MFLCYRNMKESQSGIQKQTTMTWIKTALHEDESPLKQRPMLTTTHKVKPFLSLKRLKIFQAAKYLLQLKDILDIEYKKCAVSKVKQQKQQIIVPF